MGTYDIKRLALVLAVQAEIEAHNTTDNFHKYPETEFWSRAIKLEKLSYKPNEEL